MSSQFKISKDNSTNWGNREANKARQPVSGQLAEMDTWADKGAKMDSDAGDDNWEKSSNTPEASNKNQKIHGTKEKEMESLNVDQDTWGNVGGKKKAYGNSPMGITNASTYKRKKTNADHDSSYNNVMPPSDNAWNAGDGIGRPNAKSNAGSSWGEKDKMESDEHLKVPKESDTWNTGKSNESPWDNTDALQDSWVNSATRNNNAQDGSWDKVVAINDKKDQQKRWIEGRRR
ncbi:unnamed protein product [Miscanthus lutarioriparius]|uniref:Uncharacterized protein n=1 Tax=Miscanthus lutarioriparius TaxID=422564 RepID=A0A811SRY7_9POAL|nr:unnamed protein product [Miscanthus lutarioriparius]